MPFRWDLIGFALSRAWVTAMLSHAASDVWHGGVSFETQATFYAASTLAALALVLASFVGTACAERATAVVSMTAVGLLGVVLIACCPPSSPTGLLLPGFALAGASAGYFEVAWGRRFVDLDAAKAQAYTLLMFALAAAMGAFASLLGGTAFLLLAFVLPVGAAACFLAPPARVRPALDERPRERGSSRATPIAGLLVCVLVYSTVYSLVVGLAYDFLAADEASLVRFVTNLVTALALLVLSLALRPLGAASVLRLVMPVTALGFVMYLLSPECLGIAALLVSGAGRKLFDILTWVIVARAARDRGIRHDVAFGLLIAGKDFGFLAGLATSAVILRDAPGSTQVMTIVPVVLIILIVCFSWVFPERRVDRLLGGTETENSPTRDGQARAEGIGGRVRDGHDGRVAALARAYGLTRREADVFSLLARGRTQSVIAGKLGISTGTAHTHIIHVYQKLGVNRQQDLIEMVEAWPAGLVAEATPGSGSDVNPPLR